MCIGINGETQLEILVRNGSGQQSDMDLAYVGSLLWPGVSEMPDILTRHGMMHVLDQLTHIN